MILGLDVGGANTKVASSDGLFVKIEYLPLWKDAPLEALLCQISNDTNPSALGVVMTGELADCFSDKRSGILHIMGAIERSFSCPIRFWGAKGFGWTSYLELAAANWSASAALISEEIGDCIFIDMGSTTTDLVPIKNGARAALTDYERLARGELIYSGLLRTNLAALLSSVEIGGRKVPLSSELFAVTADAYRALDEMSDESYSIETPDCGDKDREAALNRLSRTVCADLEEIGLDAALDIARQAKARQIEVLKCALGKMASEYELEQVVAAGIGEEIIAKAARELDLGYLSLSRKYGNDISAVFPAYAVARLLEMDIENGKKTILTRDGGADLQKEPKKRPGPREYEDPAL